MHEYEFRTWLEHKKRITPRPISDYVSRCKRVERNLKISLDEEFKKDGGYSTMKLLANADDSALSSRLKFSEGAVIERGLASLRSAVNTYFEFCQDV